MSQYQRIFLIADPSMRRTPAFERAVWLAKKSEAALHIALFDRNSFLSAAALISKEASAEAIVDWTLVRNDWLHMQAAQLLHEGGLEVTTEFVWARPAQDEILLRVADQAPDLLIKDVEYESHLKRVMFRPLDWQLLRHSVTPLLLVNDRSQANPRRVIAAVDATDDSVEHNALNHRVIEQARRLAMLCGAELHLIYVYAAEAATADPSGPGATLLGEIYNTMLPAHRRHFEELANTHEIPMDCRHFLFGPPAFTITEFAGADRGDVLVIGSMRHGLADRLLMGTTAEAILDHASCNVLAVKI